MKRIALIYLAVLSACSTGGPGNSPSPDVKSPLAANTFVVDFQTGFDRTPVELQVDGQQVFSEALTTDERVGLARSLKLTARNPLRTTAVVTVDHTNHYTYQIQLDRGPYIGFSKNLDTGKLQMEQRQHPPEYD